MKTKRLLLLIAMLCVVAALAVVLLLARANKGEVIVKNAATESIVQCHIEICSQSFDLGSIAPSESKKATYKVRGTSHYAVSLQFESGKKISKNLAYVTHGLDFRDLLNVNDNDIFLQESTNCKNLDRNLDCMSAVYNPDGSIAKPVK